MKNLQTYDEFLNESQLNEASQRGKVIFSVDDDKLDTLLHSRFGKQLDYEDIKGDSYYVMLQKDFDRFIDLADSSGFDVDGESEDSVIDIVESRLNEFGPLAGSGNVRANDLDNIKREAAKKSERGNTVYVIGGKYGSYKLSKYFEEGNTYAAYYNGMPQVVESINEEYREFSVADFPIGAEVTMADEIWKVTKPGVKNGKVFMAPFNNVAKKRYISIAIEFDLNWLNSAVTKIEK